MKRLTIGFLACGVLATSVAAADAGPTQRKTTRTVVGRYEAFPAPVTGCNTPLGSFACLITRPRSDERYVVAKVTDTHGLPVYFEIHQPGGSPQGFCGSTTGPIELIRRQPIAIDVGLPRWGVQISCPTSVKTTGTITLTLSNLP
jgi:hypothetical protein